MRSRTREEAGPGGGGVQGTGRHTSAHWTPEKAGDSGWAHGGSEDNGGVTRGGLR